MSCLHVGLQTANAVFGSAGYPIHHGEGRGRRREHDCRSIGWVPLLIHPPNMTIPHREIRTFMEVAVWHDSKDGWLSN